MAVTSCAYEFQRKHIGFADAKPTDFYSAQWFRFKSVYVAYRACIFVYCLLWSIMNAMHLIKYDTKYYAYLSNWGEWTLVAHFFLHLVVSIYGLTRDAYFGRSEPDCCMGNKCNKDELRWFHHLTWVTGSASTGAQYIITILYWSFLTDNKVTSNAVNIHQHVMNSVLVTIDLFISRVPVRFLHFVYVSLYGITYVLITLILHGANDKSEFYAGILDWKSEPGVSTGVVFAVILVGAPAVHAVSFGFYHLRAFIAIKSSCMQPTVGENGNEGGDGENNVGLEVMVSANGSARV
uniref:protein rolling stone-like n=1 Tax=Styela clava TaxID=7725 RepID=UPI00193A92C5|nr:protein rolling stone-like [Styela clava]